jgi:hypothetical protein
LLHNLGNRVLLLEWGRYRTKPLRDAAFGRSGPVGRGSYFPPRTSLAIVASCMFDVPS